MTYQNIRDVLALPAVADGTLWFRPVGWKRCALCCDGNYINCAPFANRPKAWLPFTLDFIEDREVVPPEQVLAERNHAS